MQKILTPRRKKLFLQSGLIMVAISIVLLLAQYLPTVIIYSLEADAVDGSNKCQWTKSTAELFLCKQILKLTSGNEMLLSQTLANQAVIYMKQGKIAEARRAAEENVSLMSAWQGWKSLSLIAPINLLAQTFRVNAEYVRAEQLYDQAIEIAAHNNQKPFELAMVLHQKAVLDLYLGRDKEASELTDQIAEIYKQMPANTNRQCEILVLRSDQAEARGDYRTAKELANKALQIRSRPQSDSPEKRMESLNQVVRLYQALQQYNLSQDSASELLRLVNAAPECPESVHVNDLLALGEQSVADGKLVDAEEQAQRALNICTRLYGPNHPYKGNCLVLLSKICRQNGKLSESISLINQALSIYGKSLGPENRLIASALAERASALKLDKNFSLSKNDYERSISMAKKLLPDNHPLLANLYESYAKLLSATKENSKALWFNDKAKHILLDARK